MKTKNRFITLFLTISLLLLIAACGTKEDQQVPLTKDSTVEDLDGKVLAFYGAPYPVEEIKSLIDQAKVISLKEVLAVPSSGELALLIQNGQADAGATHLCNAKYIVSRNPGLTYFTTNDMDCTMVFAKGSGLRDSVDEALNELEENGTMDELIKTWLSDEAMEQDPVPEELETIPDAETIRVGISGTMPPMDYATADGKPGGFNVALMREISKLLNKNVEFVTVEADSRFMALSSGKIDVFFWTWNFYGASNLEEYDVSQTYFTDKAAFLIRAKEN